MKTTNSTLIRIVASGARGLAAAAVLAASSAAVFSADRDPAFPGVAELPAQSTPPDPLLIFQGPKVTSSEQWFTTQRPMLGALFAHYMYGHIPPRPTELKFLPQSNDTQYFGGKATKKEILIRVGPEDAPAIHLLLVVPNRRPAGAPVFLGVNFRGNHAVLKDPSISISPRFSGQEAAAARGADAGSWCVEQVIDHGYAVATFHNGDLEPDRPDAPDGIRAYYRDHRAADGRFDWGAVAAWAWSLHRAVDYLLTDPDIDASRIAIIGHSRNGKAALLSAALDPRVAMVVPIQAGCGGTAPSRGKLGETVKQINDRFPHWFNDEFKKFNDQVERLPFDQHCLVALMAPRPVLFACATEDTWANPPGQFEMLEAAEPVYRLLRAGSLGAHEMPPTGHLIDSTLGYFIRPGKHSVTLEDWQLILAYADNNLKRATP